MEAAHFFEGTEKLLEVWFSRQQPDANQGSGDLRTIPRWVPVRGAPLRRRPSGLFAPSPGEGDGRGRAACFRWARSSGRGDKGVAGPAAASPDGGHEEGRAGLAAVAGPRTALGGGEAPAACSGNVPGRACGWPVCPHPGPCAGTRAGGGCGWVVVEG